MWRGGAGHRGAAALHRLAQRLQRLAGELRQLVEEQHAAMGEADLARPGALAAAGQRRLLGGVVRLAERRAHHQPPAVQHAGDRVDHRHLQRLHRRRGRAAGRAAGRPAWTCRSRAGRSAACCGRRRRRSPARAGPIPCRAPRRGRARRALRRRRPASGGVQHLGAAEMVDQRQQVGRREHLDPAGPGRLAALRWRADQPELARRGADRRGQHAGHRVERAVQRQFARGRRTPPPPRAAARPWRPARRARSAGRNGCLP